MPGSILTLNAGSSSLKFALFDVDAAAGDEMLAMARGEIENLDEAPHLLARDVTGAVLAEQHWQPGIADPFTTVLDALLAFADAHLGEAGLAAVGHRIVHGGGKHIAPARVTPALLTDLEALTSLDPLHIPHNLAPIHAVAASRPALAQVACFDTAFHHTLPPVAQRFGLPRALEAAGVRRYGFHGLSYKYIATQLARHAPALARGRVLAAHLGSGASLCALHEGRSIATTMGFSALDGLLMATRCGSLDPGVMLYLGRRGTASPILRTCSIIGPVCWVSPASAATYANCSRAAIPMPAKRSSCSPTASRRRRARWSAPSAGWTGWSSPPGSVNTRRRFGPPSARG